MQSFSSCLGTKEHTGSTKIQTLSRTNFIKKPTVLDPPLPPLSLISKLGKLLPRKMCFGAGKRPYIDKFGLTESFEENPGPCRVNPEWDPNHPHRCKKFLRLEPGEEPVLPDPAAVRLAALRRRGYKPVKGMHFEPPAWLKAAASAGGAGSEPGSALSDPSGAVGGTVAGNSRTTATEAGTASRRSGTNYSRGESHNNTSRRSGTSTSRRSGADTTNGRTRSEIEHSRGEHSNYTSRRSGARDSRSSGADATTERTPTQQSNRRSGAHSEIPGTRFQPDSVLRRSSPPPLGRGPDQQSAHVSGAHSEIPGTRFQPDTVQRRPSPPGLRRRR